MNWETIPLGELAVERGGSVNPVKFQDETFDLFSIPAHDAGFHEVRNGREIGSSKKCIEPNDVLISKIVPHIRRVWIVPPKGENRQIASGEWIQYRDDRILPRFMRHFLLSDHFHHQFMRTVSGVGGSLLRASPKLVNRIIAPLPPLAEQKRIAAILDAADALRTKRRQTIEQLDTFLQSVFLDMFGDPVTNPKKWEVYKSGSLFKEKPRIGTVTPAKGKGLLVVRVGEVGQTQVAFEKCGRVSITDSEIEKYKLEIGDTVIARAIGSKNHLGKSSYFCGHKETIIIDSHVMRLRPDDQICNPIWFYSLLSSPFGKLLLQQSGGPTAVQFNINAKQASGIKIPLPPIALQKKFASLHSVYSEQKSRLQAHLTKLEELFASLQSSAFKGEL